MKHKIRDDVLHFVRRRIMISYKTLLVVGASATLAFSACSKNDDEGTPTSWQATVAHPGGTLAFHWLNQMETYGQNNTPQTQNDANVLASQYGKQIPQGTVVQVVATYDFPNVNLLLNDRNLCEIKPQGSDDRFWVQCADLRKGPFVANRALPAKSLPRPRGGGFPQRGDSRSLPRTRVDGFPRLGDSKSLISSELGSNISDDPNDVLTDVYYLPVSGQNVRVWIHYSVEGQKELVGLLTFRVASSTLDSDTVAVILAKVLPSDAEQVTASAVGPAAQEDATGLSSNESVKFFNSTKLANVVDSGSCSRSDPGTIEVDRSRDDNGDVTDLVITSAYLYHCQSSRD